MKKCTSLFVESPLIFSDLDLSSINWYLVETYGRWVPHWFCNSTVLNYGFSKDFWQHCHTLLSSLSSWEIIIQNIITKRQLKKGFSIFWTGVPFALNVLYPETRHFHHVVKQGLPQSSQSSFFRDVKLCIMKCRDMSFIIHRTQVAI